MKRLVLLAGLLTCGISPAFAATDYICVDDCLRKGYLYKLCVLNCSYDSQPSKSWYDTQVEIQQQKEEARKRQRILDLELEEAEAKAAERRQKSLKTPESE